MTNFNKNSGKKNISTVQTNQEQEMRFSELWQEFNSTYPDEAACVETICKALHGELKCKNCGSSRIHRHYGQRVGRCSDCKTDIYITAGTFFHGIRTFRPWLAAIWLRERGIAVRSTMLVALLPIASSSAWHLLKKIDFVVQNLLSEEDSAQAVSSAMFAQTIKKRSKETPARQHPYAEQEELEKQNPLHHKSPMGLSSDTLASLSDGVHFICASFQGISRKYLQPYLAAHWSQSDKSRWKEGILMYECGRSRYISGEEISGFVSPPLVKIMPLAESAP